MRLPSIGSLASLVPVIAFTALTLGCGGGPKGEAKAPETNPWADYKGTYGGPAEAASTTETKSASTTEAKPATSTPDAPPAPETKSASSLETKPAGAADKPKAGKKPGGKAGAKKAPRAKS